MTSICFEPVTTRCRGALESRRTPHHVGVAGRIFFLIFAGHQIIMQIIKYSTRRDNRNSLRIWKPRSLIYICTATFPLQTPPAAARARADQLQLGTPHSAPLTHLIYSRFSSAVLLFTRRQEDLRQLPQRHGPFPVLHASTSASVWRM